MTVEFFMRKPSYEYTQARRHRRVPADFPVRLRSEHLRLADRAFDVSEGGVGLETREPLPPMELVSMQLECPHAERPVEALGRVIWAHGNRMGLRFEQADGHLLDAIARLRQDFERI
jgi:hypothetical protein